MKDRLSKSLEFCQAFVKRLFNSTFLITVAAILTFSALIEALNPLNLLFFTGLTSIRQNNMVSKLPKIIKSKDNPDVLVLGSSISLYPMGRLDDVEKEGRTRWDETYVRYKLCPYTKADYFKGLLANNLGKEISLTNASVVAAVISDQYLILDKYIKSGQKPKLLVLFTAPRDFMFNNSSQIGKSPTYEILADMQNLSDVVANSPDFQTIVEFAFGQVCSYYNVRRDYHGVLLSAASRITGRPMSQHDAESGDRQKPVNIFDVDRFWEAKAIYKQPPNRKRQYDYYKNVYNPLDEKQFAQQKEFFHKFLKLAKENNIKVCIVDTPVPKIHYDLIPESGLNRYRELLLSACKNNNALLVKPGQYDSYELSDFEDVSHMNISGATKMTKLVSNKLAKDNSVAKSLGAKNILLGNSKSAKKPL